jgi:alanine-synthesizing transaminase
MRYRTYSISRIPIAPPAILAPDVFSHRTNWDLQPSRLSLALEHRRAAGLPVLDLTLSNPTVAGFDYDLADVANALAAGCSHAYAPVAQGLPTARQAVSLYYEQDHGVSLDPAHIVLTVSTSEAYSFLFRLLCDPGDEVLVCRPAYPLFDYLAELEDVALRPVGWLHDEDGWHLDTHALQLAFTARTKAVLLVHPNNPTGHFVSPRDRQWLDIWCAEHGLALIVDEVFLEYRLQGGGPSFLASPSSALTFVLSGISKICALPQMKVAWIASHGPADLRDAALARLDVIADTFLSLSTPFQAALPSLLHIRRQIQPQILARLHANLTLLDERLAGEPLLTREEVEGGWYATLRLPSLTDSESSAVRLLQDTGVYVHPGHFFGFAGGGCWVISLLGPSAEFYAAMDMLATHIKKLA